MLTLQLHIEAPPELAAIRARLESIDPRRFVDIAQIVGLRDEGPLVRVVLAPEDSDRARGVSPWVAGYAVDESDLVVIFPARSPTYPHDSLEDVLRHEVAHILIGRAAGGRLVPRWFNEGLAMSAERERRIADQTQFLYQLVTGSRTSVGELNRLFTGDQSDQTRAYALAGAMVQDLLQRQGISAAPKLFTRMREGADFDVAFKEVFGWTPEAASDDFWQRKRLWNAWLPIVTSTTTLWLAVTLIALLAIYRRWRRNLEIEKKWEEDEHEERQ